MYLRKRYETVSQNIPKTKHLIILDVGCGDGTHSLMYTHYHKASVVGVDIISHSNWKTIKNESLIHFIVADANHLPFREFSFDVLTMTEVLEHLDDDETYLKNVNKILKNKGILIITTPNGARITSLIARIGIFLKKIMKGGFNPGDHRREYSCWELVKVLSKNGFRLKCHSYVSFCPYLPIFNKVSQKRALRLFNLLDNIFNNNLLAPLLRWGLVAVSIRYTKG